ncbi:MAG: 6-phosphofructokinase, partial [Firmicutes bacterium]|nr:6-phosphofructokinase [Bacillota bacterium]
DRVLSVRYGVKAAELIAEGKFGNMVCLKNGKMDCVSLEDVIGSERTSTSGGKLVDPNGELVKCARNLGISFGDV